MLTPTESSISDGQPSVSLIPNIPSTGLAPPAKEPREHYDSPNCDCLSHAKATALLLAAKELLQVIDEASIRKAALACGAELYERAAALLDAIASAETEWRP